MLVWKAIPWLPIVGAMRRHLVARLQFVYTAKASGPARNGINRPVAASKDARIRGAAHPAKPGTAGL